eukprot:CAMPEP_0184393718 /NCGR_PEP_ID=MMETSP0007-20130409/36166_1 /TAXON_ID=97485 /ORGANISM="Prymnesium parvum, Strain Texoma1" /LENGTH=104 /DNA_ID=CAMNT_0026744905 /DNA_START=295 /DNA_END=606 /DNA_ORIENTATION=-
MRVTAVSPGNYKKPKAGSDGPQSCSLLHVRAQGTRDNLSPTMLCRHSSTERREGQQRVRVHEMAVRCTCAHVWVWRGSLTHVCATFFMMSTLTPAPAPAPAPAP